MTAATTRQLAPRMRRPADPAGLPATRVLLLHGMGAGVRSWDALAPLLAPRLELWDVSLPWSLAGDSAWARGPAVGQWVSDPVAHLRRVTGRAPDVLVAHSFAANVVLELLTGPDQPPAAAVVLISPLYRGGDRELDWSAVVPSLQACYARGIDEMRRRRSSRISDAASETLARRLFELMGAHAALRFYETYQRTPGLPLESLTIPVLLVGGSDDPGASPPSVRALGERIPRVSLRILDGGGHFPATTRPRELAGVVNGFLDEAVPAACRPAPPEVPR